MPLLQPPVPKLPASLDLSGKTAIVTGGNAGIGLEVARHFLHLNLSHLILAVRTPAKGEDAKRQLLADPIVAKRNPVPTISVFRLDLTAPSSVIEFAGRVEREAPRLEILVLNAGVYPMNFALAPETKNEVGYQVNHLSNALLAVLLLPTLQRTGGPAHITVLGSRMATRHTFAKRPIDMSKTVAAHFNDPAHFSWGTHYGDTKYVVQAFWHAMASRMDASRVIVNAICPGQVSTGLGADGQPKWVSLIRPLVNLRGRTPEEGARCVVYAAAAAGLDSHGALVADMDVFPPFPFSETPTGRALEQKIWKETLETAESLVPGSTSKAGLV
ncbi:hypothetical protein EV714DRAFT_248595, partial [Schizophyllum commune]